MPKQPDDLFGGQFSLAPDLERSQPRLWVRRLAIWREPGTSPFRDYSFHPGLNIVWSLSVRETTGEQDGVIGHGSGKTLLCRLIRYCLGERRFASEELRDAIGTQFPEGLVGAEIMLDGICWAVVRPLGQRQRHVAVANGNLDAIAAGEGSHTSMEPFITAVENAFFTPESIALIPGGQVWLTELAWLSRDQECDFKKVQEWRDAASRSESPARSLATDEAKFFALRVFLKAITPEERALSDEIKAMEAERDQVKQEIAHRLWEADQKKNRLAIALEMKKAKLDGPLAAEDLKQTARKKFAEVARVSPSCEIVDPEPLRAELKEAQAKEKSLSERLAGMKGRLEEKKKTFDRMRNEVVGLVLSTDEEENPSCPICEEPIDRVLAEGCKLSHKLADLESIRQKRENHRLGLEKVQADLTALRENIFTMEQEHKEAQTAVATLEARLGQIEEARDARRDSWYQARRMVDDADRYAELLQQYASKREDLDSLINKIEDKREQRTLFRGRKQQLFTKISGIFDHVVRELVGREASGSVRLTGDGVKPEVRLGGLRQTPGTECIGILAFDLTALCLSTEKDAQIAPFFIHDSPRTADLDIEVYYRLFRFVKDLPEQLGQPLFQYIVTTTTPPPEELRDPPWTPVRLRGAPAEERLLGLDLAT
ncbi:chromosome segregation protein SMC [Phaeospirillum tilakii]|uniref:Chromosome segregation protein SMC n=1 Tax=Phaeospirillum tilakii TaxID=741673 RepID=A0ABW5C8Z5_9PROT